MLRDDDAAADEAFMDDGMLRYWSCSSNGWRKFAGTRSRAGSESVEFSAVDVVE